MKNKLILFLLLSLGMFAIPACTDLEVNELDSVPSTSETGGSSDPTALLASSYEDLGAFNDQANIYSLTEHVSDEMIPPTRGVDWGDNGVWRTLHAHTWDASHAYVLNSWNQLNERAFKCTRILASNPTAEQAAEAKFLRAFYMYHVMDLWGQVPFKEANQVGVIPEVKSRMVAFDFIVKDLNEALPLLPDLGPVVEGNGKASKSAANALLARMYLNKAVYSTASGEGPYTFDGADMDKVIAAADAIAAAGYDLDDNYFNNFSSQATNELIFRSTTGSSQNRTRMTLHYDHNPDGWNGFATLADFYNKFEANDTRIGNYPTPDGTEFSGIARGFLVGQQLKDDGTPVIEKRSGTPLIFKPECPLSGATTQQGIRVVKYHPSDQAKLIFFRYADVLLMKAEALMRKNDDAAALALVNTLRAKRGASTLTSLDATKMLDERGFELYWEGIRRIDQIRFETFNKPWSEKIVTESFRVLFPIPQQALDSNPNLQQNKGY